MCRLVTDPRPAAGRRPLVGALLLGLAGSCDPGGQLLPPHPPSHCGVATCESGAALSAALPVPPSEIASLVVTLCRNGVCVSSLPTVTGDGSYGCPAYGPLSARCRIVPAGAASTLELFVTGRVDDFQDGDRYTVDVAPAGGQPVLHLDERATYTVSRPNGDGCDPVCRLTTL